MMLSDAGSTGLRLLQGASPRAPRRLSPETDTALAGRGCITQTSDCTGRAHRLKDWRFPHRKPRSAVLDPTHDFPGPISVIVKTGD